MDKKKHNNLIFLIEEIQGFAKRVTSNRLSVYAACTAFYIFISFIPFLMIILALIPYLPFNRADFTKMLLDFVPKDYDYVVTGLIEDLYLNNTKALWASLIALFWASGRGVLGITQGLNEIEGVTESRNFIYMRIRSGIYTLALAFGMLFTLLLSVFGTTLLNIINNFLHLPDVLINILEYRNFFVFGVLVAMFVFFFTVLPNKKMKVKSQLPGAFIAALIWWGFTRLFSFWISTFKSYTMYGSFAIVIIVGIWLYTGMYIMFMGALLNNMAASKKGNKNERQN